MPVKEGISGHVSLCPHRPITAKTKAERSLVSKAKTEHMAKMRAAKGKG